jgi:tetratricopeptide (TPR) repeat protein
VLLRITFVLLASLLLGLPIASGQGHFTETLHIQQAYQMVHAGRLAEAETLLDAQRAEDPDNLLIYYIADLSDFLRCFVTEKTRNISAYEEQWRPRMDALKKGDQADPYFLFAQAELHLHAALLDFKLGNNFDAATSINRGFRLLKRNERKFPDFAPNLKNLGLLRAGVGTIPDEYRWAVKLISSLEGTVPEGLSDLRRGLRKGRQTKILQIPEMQFFYALSLLHFSNQPAAAWEYLQTLAMDPHSSPVTCFIYVNVAMKTGHNDSAVEILTHRTFHPRAMQLPYLDFMLGSALLYRTDPHADKPLLRFLETFQGENYMKEAYQKLAWHSLVHGDEDSYHTYMKECLAHGTMRIDEDRYAQEEALAGVAPHAGLLKARLLYDGGYLVRAEGVLDTLDRTSLGIRDDLEYGYRMGRILHAAGREAEALDHYRQTIDQGRETPYYFACNAALQSGLLYEKQGSVVAAEEYFRICLSLKPDAYKASLHQKAKAGLSRIQGRE